MAHTPVPDPIPVLTAEPVALTEAIRLILVALVGLGWITLDDTALSAILSAVGVLLSWGLAAYARSRVTPVGR